MTEGELIEQAGRVRKRSGWWIWIWAGFGFWAGHSF
jgi:hypothetical protein